jgi:Mn-dependent DtxR family transcriptional regulator
MQSFDWHKMHKNELHDFGISDSEVFNAIEPHKIDLMKHILHQAQCGYNWRQSESCYIASYGLDEFEVENFLKENWSKNMELRERKKLQRTLAESELFFTDWLTTYRDRASNLKISPAVVTEYAKRLASTEYGRRKITDNIAQGALSPSEANWSERYQKVIETHGINVQEIESTILSLRESQLLREEESQSIRNHIDKQRKIMSCLDVGEHPDFTADELVEARNQAVLPKFRSKLLDALVQMVLDGKQFHPNYHSYMLAQGITHEFVFESARKSTVNSIISKVDVQKPCFENSLHSWHRALTAIDANLLDAYRISEKDLEMELRETLRKLLLRDICLNKPKDYNWISRYLTPMQIAGLTEQEALEYLAKTEHLNPDAIENLFKDLPNSPNFSHERSKRESDDLRNDLAQLSDKFKSLWRERYAHFGDICFDIDVRPLSKLRVSKIRGADLLDTSPTFETEAILIEAVTKIAQEIEKQQKPYYWSTEYTFTGVWVETDDDDGRGPLD